MKPRVKIDPAETKSRYLAGESMEAIAKSIGASIAGVKESLQRQHVEMRGSGGTRKGMSADWNRTLDEDLIKKLYVEDGLSTLEIADKLGVSPGGVRVALKRVGVTLRTRKAAREFVTLEAMGTIPTKEWIEKIVQEAGYNQQAAADYNGISYQTLRKYVKLFKVEILRPTKRTISRRTKIDVQEAISLSREGMSFSDICSTVGTSMYVLLRSLKEAGYSAPRGSRIASDTKAAVLRELGVTECQICNEARVLDFCHIKPERDGGLVHKDNCLILCPTHHKCFDRNKLTHEEFALVKERVRKAESLFDYKLPHYQEW